MTQDAHYYMVCDACLCTACIPIEVNWLIINCAAIQRHHKTRPTSSAVLSALPSTWGCCWCQVWWRKLEATAVQLGHGIGCWVEALLQGLGNLSYPSANSSQKQTIGAEWILMVPNFLPASYLVYPYIFINSSCGFFSHAAMFQRYSSKDIRNGNRLVDPVTGCFLSFLRVLGHLGTLRHWSCNGETESSLDIWYMI